MGPKKLSLNFLWRTGTFFRAGRYCSNSLMAIKKKHRYITTGRATFCHVLYKNWYTLEQTTPRASFETYGTVLYCIHSLCSFLVVLPSQKRRMRNEKLGGERKTHQKEKENTRVERTHAYYYAKINSDFLLSKIILVYWRIQALIGTTTYEVLRTKKLLIINTLPSSLTTCVLYCSK